MQNEVDDQPPQRRPNHQPLGQSQPVVVLPQRNARDDIANHRKGQEFGDKNQQPGDDAGIDRHLARLNLKVCAGPASRRDRQVRADGDRPALSL